MLQPTPCTLVLFLLPLLLACTPPSSDTPPPTIAWQPQPSSTEARLIGSSAVDDAVAWVSGTSGAFARTLDGGQTWLAGTVPGADSLQFRDVHAVSADTAYLLSAGTGTDARIYRTDDGGITWTLQFSNPEPAGFFDCMDFWDDQRGVVFSDALDGVFYLLTTADGGTTWTRVPPSAFPPALPGEGSFASSGTCLVAQPGGHAWVGTGASGVEARVLHTTDYGQTWTLAPTPIIADSPTAGIYSLAFRDAQHGIALGGDFSRTQDHTDNIAITQDGGATWTLAGRPQFTGAVYGSTYVPGTDLLVAVGPKGSDYSTDHGQTWARIDTLEYWGITSAGPEATWAVGPAGRVAHLTLMPGEEQP